MEMINLSANQLRYFLTLISVLLFLTISLPGCNYFEYAGNLDTQKEESETIKAKADIKAIQIALELYHTDYGEYPENLNELVEVGILESLPRDENEMSYKRISDEEYSLSTTLPNGEKYTVTPEDNPIE